MKSVWLFSCLVASIAFHPACSAEAELAFAPLRGHVPSAPHDPNDARNESLCQGDARKPEGPEDQAIAKAGWLLVSAAQQMGSTRVAMAAAAMSGQCEPQDFRVFVFHGGQIVGEVHARDKQAMPSLTLRDEKSLLVSVNFHKPGDAHCCASGHESLVVDIPAKQP